MSVPADHPTAPLLRVEDVVVAYPRKGLPPMRALAGVGLEIAPGEVVGIVGESDCGKSTLARAITGLAPVRAGSVTFDGTPVGTMGRRRRAPGLLPLQMVFQDPNASLNPRRTIGAQIQEVVVARERAQGSGRGRRDPETAREAVEALRRVGLPDGAADKYPHEFSGGQRQRAAIARALASRPKMIVADEPVSALDASAQAAVANLLRDLSREEGIALAFISHDLAVVGALADRVVVMYLGRIVETGTVEQIFNAPRHPYTRALLVAVPVPDGTGARPRALTGEVPDPGSPPPGCRFHPRCPLAVDRCRTDEPQLLGTPGATEGSDVACWVAQTQEPAAV
ncbi:ABC transporter ATP-binding protein [Streptomyces sp. DH41]|uniref:ABC transporter ATP-binding protein n=1 Tax=Streptomyces sp. DH41 TaxID=3040125 RepID=UPI0024434965|nr:ABC transporter ATP-binding protein [Streptomyces sp. DH41]MDG9723263.1 ABC transporter ATP-binding protein [Streptomyces sp. DH41]